jgi:tetratricopeptide (TPR) repeat protein
VYLLGWVQAAQGQHEHAAQTLAHALRLKSDDLATELHLSESLLAAGQLDEARAMYERVLRVRSDRADARYGLGRIAAARGDWHAAVASYQRACELFPSYGPAHYALAMAFRRLGRDDEAEQQLRLYEQDKTGVPPLDDPLRREVTSLNLGSVAHIRRGADLERAGRISDAIDEQHAALRVDPHAVQAHINLIALYGRLGRYDEAMAQYELARALDPSQADLHYNHGIVLLRQQRSGEAADAFREALRLNPHYVEAHNNLGTIYENGGDSIRAREQFTAALADQPANRVAHFHLGRMLANEQRYDEAIAHLQQTLVPEDASTPRYLYAVGATYARAGRTADALKYLRQAREQAASRNQAALVTSIERDLQTLEHTLPASPR